MKGINSLSKFLNFDSFVFTALLTCSAITLKNAYDVGRFPLLQSVEASKRNYNFDKYLTPKIVNNLERNGFVVINNVLSNEELLSISKDITELNESQLKFEDSPNKDDTVRTDKLCFIVQSNRNEVIKMRPTSLASENEKEAEMSSNSDKSTSNINRHAPGESLLHGQNILLGLGNSLLKCGFTGFEKPTANELEHNDNSARRKDEKMIINNLFVPDQVMLSLYSSSGSFYSSHLDAVTPSMFYSMGIVEWLKSYCYRVRVVTAILYLNTGGPWNGNEKCDGGCLRIYLNKDQELASRQSNDINKDLIIQNGNPDENKGSNNVAYIDIAPEGGRLVIFDSQTILHEVLPSRRKRHALSIWLTSNN